MSNTNNTAPAGAGGSNANAGPTSFNLQRLFYAKNAIPTLEGPGSDTGPSLHLWLKILERSFEAERITDEEEKIAIACCHISPKETSTARIVVENCLEVRNARTFAELKRALLNNLAPSTSTRLFDQFDELLNLQWNRNTSISTHINQSLGYFNSYLEEVEARYNVTYSPEGQKIFLMSILYHKLQNRPMKMELNKAMATANKTVTELVAELTEKLSMHRPAVDKVNAIGEYEGRGKGNWRDKRDRKDKREDWRDKNSKQRDRDEKPDYQRSSIGRNNKLKTSWRDRVEEAIQRDNGRGREYARGQRRRNNSEESEKRFASPRRRSYVRWNLPDKRRQQGQGSRRVENKYGYQYEERDDRRSRSNRGSPIRWYPNRERKYSPSPPLFRNRRRSDHAVNELRDQPSRKDIWEKKEWRWPTPDASNNEVDSEPDEEYLPYLPDDESDSQDEEDSTDDEYDQQAKAMSFLGLGPSQKNPKQE